MPNAVSALYRRFVARHPGDASEDERVLNMCDEIDRLQVENDRLSKALKLYIATAAATRP